MKLRDVLERFSDAQRSAVRAACVDDRWGLNQRMVDYFARVVIQPRVIAASAEELPERVERKCCQYKSCGNTDLELKLIEHFAPDENGLYRKTVTYEYVRCSNGETMFGFHGTLEEIVDRLNDATWFPVDVTAERSEWHRMVTPELIEELDADEIFVFGSNADGQHAGGAAHVAVSRFGAIWGQGHGRQGQAYAIDTMSGAKVLAREATAFIEYARLHPELTFLLTPVGCGIAGYSADEVAPLFANAPDNVSMPQSFQDVLDRL